MEDIAKSWNNLSLHEREGLDLTLQTKLRSSEFIKATKFLIRRALNMEVVVRMFRQLWWSTNGFKIRNLEDHIVLFVFSTQIDVTRIIQSEPWCFDKHLLCWNLLTAMFLLMSYSFKRPRFGSKCMIFQSVS